MIVEKTNSLLYRYYERVCGIYYERVVSTQLQHHLTMVENMSQLVVVLSESSEDPWI